MALPADPSTAHRPAAAHTLNKPELSTEPNSSLNPDLSSGRIGVGPCDVPLTLEAMCCVSVVPIPRHSPKMQHPGAATVSSEILCQAS